MVWENQLASINRNLAGGGYLNVAKFVVPPSERSRIRPDAKFFSAELYAAMPPGWEYEDERCHFVELNLRDRGEANLITL